MHLDSVSSLRYILAWPGIILPRILVAAALLAHGMRYLIRGADMGDLVLNAVALAFVTDLDELFFTTFVPGQLGGLQGSMKPLPLPTSKFSRRHPAFGAWLLVC